MRASAPILSGHRAAIGLCDSPELCQLLTAGATVSDMSSNTLIVSQLLMNTHTAGDSLLGP